VHAKGFDLEDGGFTAPLAARRAVASSADKCTCWRACGFKPSDRIESTKRVTVP
jgi:hypothetical protein